MLKNSTPLWPFCKAHFYVKHNYHCKTFYFQCGEPRQPKNSNDPLFLLSDFCVYSTFLELLGRGFASPLSDVKLDLKGFQSQRKRGSNTSFLSQCAITFFYWSVSSNPVLMPNFARSISNCSWNELCFDDAPRSTFLTCHFHLL